MNLRSSSQQPPVLFVKRDRLQPRVEPVTSRKICHLHAVPLGHVADKKGDRAWHYVAPHFQHMVALASDYQLIAQIFEKSAISLK